MKRKPKMHEVLTDEVRSCVNAYLMARAYAETMRARVDEVHRKILTECPIYADKSDGRQILTSGDLYLSKNEVHCRDFYDEADKRLKAAKIKPNDMPTDWCPALVAENLQTKTERLLIDASGEPFGVTYHNLLCAGLDARQKWLDLIVEMVVNSRGFKNPLTGE